MEAADLAVGTAAIAGLLKPVPLHTQNAISKENFAGALSKSSQSFLPSDRIIDWSLNWANWIYLVQPAELASLRNPILLVGTNGRLGENAVDLFAAPATVQGALQRGDKPIWDGNAREVPGVLVQAVLIQSLNLGHWLTPISQSLCTGAAASLGVLLAASYEQRRNRLIAVGLIIAIIWPMALYLAIWQLILIPLVIPFLALLTTASNRND
jgi:hypothetical protein